MEGLKVICDLAEHRLLQPASVAAISALRRGRWCARWRIDTQGDSDEKAAPVKPQWQEFGLNI
jgi:hypothetical protein